VCTGWSYKNFLRWLTHRVGIQAVAENEVKLLVVLVQDSTNLEIFQGFWFEGLKLVLSWELDRWEQLG